MSEIAALVSEHLDIWAAATERKNGAGRGGGKRMRLYGIERLRGLILDLAVQGKLLPQDASDEAASASLVLARKSLSARANDVRRLRWKPSRPFEAKEIGRPLPPGWTLARVNDTGFYINGLAFKPSDWSDRGRPIIRIQNLTNPSTPYNYAEGDYPDEVIARDGDLLVSWSATLAAFQWSGEDAILNQHIFRVIHEPALTERAYLRLILEHAIAEMAESEHAHGLVMTHINRGPFLDHLVKVPPLAEQRRIVAKVGELMALCDALEDESAAALAAHQTLVETLLATLVNSADADDLAANWTRLDAQFDTLFTTDASVDALRQTVLELAIRGRLVQRDQNESPASDLIASWQRAKQEKLEQGADRRVKPAETPTEPPFSLPAHWAIQSFENIFLFIDYRGNTPPKTEDGIPLITAKNIRMGYLDREPREFVSPATYKSWMTRGFPKKGDLFFTTEAPLGNVCLNDIDEPFAIAQRAICLQPYGAANTQFLAIVIMSQSMQRIIDEAGTGMTARGIKAAKLKRIPLPVPPAAEQERIVAKVNTLLALCDSLKGGITDAGQIQTRLADAIIERAAA